MAIRTQNQPRQKGIPMDLNLRRPLAAVGVVAAAAALAGGISTAWASDGPDDAPRPTSQAEHAPADVTQAPAIAVSLDGDGLAITTVDELPADADPTGVAPAPAVAVSRDGDGKLAITTLDKVPVDGTFATTAADEPADANGK